MKFKHRLPHHLIEKVSGFEEFANGGTQISVKLKDGRFFGQILISSATWIVAMRGHQELPFRPSEIEDTFQTEEDKNPHQRGGWDYWDEWK
jgi:hypothetical protein